ncbi:YceI family protein [Polynucleobacter sphagniphilus]|jgi:polyisoprenoid-binding protein YceI|uniref:YceI family protein n=1 Tax=Polynucleobacter sphagniphilus TaxID=1743169 RepID=UPI0024753492|nr:YceI family protein [Polynucleobacter sphagniphilus]MDH6300878.1 polyisoprenoid-binding protein YceI [Polynucleobacter sphagniphilus]
MNFFYISALLLTLVTSSAQSAEIYVTDPEHTFVSFSYKHLAYSIQTSRFDRVNGTITLNDQMDGGTIEIATETGSVSTGSDTFNKLLRSEDYFNSEKFPVAKFTSDKVIFNDQTITSLSGELTIKGITKPVNIEVSNFACSRNFITLKYMCGANASAKLSRSEFNLGKYVPFVGDEISLNIVIEASKE